MRAQTQAKRPVSPAIAGPYGHPFHPIAVTVPIGAWVVSLFFDIASHLASGPATLARAAQWLIAIGIIGALLAAALGSLDLLTIARGTRTRRIALTHMTINLVVTVAFVADFLWRQNTNDGPVPAGPLTLSVISLVLLGASGYLGGMLAYRYGVRVADETTQSTGY
jgi:uncharacterized membrane protein